MINFTRIARNEFSRILDESIEHQDAAVSEAAPVIKNMALIAFTKFAKSNSLYFSLDHALSTSIIGLHLINAMRCRDGNVDSEQIVDLMASVLFCNIGIVGGILREDSGDKLKLDDQDSQLESSDFTDSSLWKYKTYRSLKFVREVPFISKNIHAEEVRLAVEHADFFGLSVSKPEDPTDIAKYVRAIQIIALMSDQNYQRRTVEFYLSAKEAGVIDTSIFRDLVEFREKWIQYFWDRLYPDVGEEILLLRETTQGRSIVSQLYSHL